MAQPSGQLALASGYSSEYFWYAQGTGIWDAKNSAMLSKTGSAGMSTNGGANVALGNGSTFYALPSTVTKADDYTLIVRAKVNTGAGTASMVLGDPIGGLGYLWLREDNNEVKLIMGAGGADFTAGAVNTLATWAFVHSGTNVLTYKDGTLVNTSTGQTSTLTITKLLSGYSGDSYALSGEFECANVIPSALSAGDISTRTANLYAVLDAGTGTDGTATGAPDTLDLIAPSATAAGTGNPDGTGAGAPASLTLTVPSATATGTSSGTNGTGSGAPTAMSMAAPSASATGTTSGSGTLVTPVLKNNTGTVLASETGITVNVYNATTGALVLHKTGQTSNGSGIVTVIDAALTPATTYAYEVVLSGGARRLPTGIVS